MKVLHINTNDTGGGAARGCYWLHEELQSQNINSQMLVLRKESADDTVHTLFEDGLKKVKERLVPRADRLLLRLYGKTSEEPWSVGFVPNNLVSRIRELSPDVVHLHWVGSGLLPIAALSKIKLPLVWTLRDMWPITGGCHYSGGCEQYQEGCGDCPQLKKSGEYDLSKLINQYKQRKWEGVDMNPVAISSWLAECANNSTLFKEREAKVIPNGIPLGKFAPVEKRQARELLGLKQDEKYILFGAINAIQDRRKGFGYLRDALLSVCTEEGDLSGLVFGNRESDPFREMDVPISALGFLNDTISLRLVYSAADVMVVPSLQEAFGKTAAESLACGTPVVCFKGTGCADIVEHGKSGYLAAPRSSEDLARGIREIVESEQYGSLCDNARSRAEQLFDIKTVAQRYIKLYSRVLENGSEV